MELIKVAIADRNTLLREGLKQVLAAERDLCVVGETGDDDEVHIVERTRPDVMLLGLIPKRKTVQILLELKKKNLPTKVLILCSFPDQESIIDSAKAGARGYVVLNGLHPSTIISAIRRIHGGETWVDRHLSCSEIFAQFARETSVYDVNEGRGDVTTVLSKRELQIISLVANGLTNQEISKQLFVSPQTVKIHLNHIFQKLGVKNRTQAALLHVQRRIRLTAA
jgi:DNA-binding NarL/FixJ family response regulator